MAVNVSDINTLPICPSTKTLRSLHPSQQATILEHLSSTLLHALSLSDVQLERLSCQDFVSSYVRDGAFDTLNALVFPERQAELERRTPPERLIRKRILLLARRLAELPKAGGLKLQAIHDLCIVYGQRNASKVKEVVGAAVNSYPDLLNDIKIAAIPSFAHILLSPESGLHALRKTLFCFTSLLQCSPAPLIDLFARNDDFVLALARCYDARLSTIAAGYGGIDLNREDETGTAAMWIRSKVALIDSFHIILQHILNDVRKDPQTNAEKAFGLVFSLLNLPSSSTSAPSTPFLNRPLIVDYQEVYSLSSTLASVLANHDDPRLDVLDATLKSFETSGSPAGKEGALKILLRSCGIAPGVGHRGFLSSSIDKGKARAEPKVDGSTANVSGIDLDAAVSSVLDILPDQDPLYLRTLLALPQYDGHAERVISALLEGEAPPPGSAIFKSAKSIPPTASSVMPSEPKIERRNIFNGQVMDVSNVTIGKQRDNLSSDAVLRDRSFLDQMKTDILRRAAELSDSDEEEAEIDEHGKKVRIAAFEEELDDVLDGRVKVAGDGEGSSESDSEKEDEDAGVEASRKVITQETILELAYIDNPKVFDRDADTRRSKARADLKTRTGWGDEQIEGWRIMLERNPKKDQILRKHEFSGNRRDIGPPAAGPSSTGQQGTRGGHRGQAARGRGGVNRGRGGGKGGGGVGGEARERAWKDKNKARQANHNRKRGHDRKLARGGAIPGPSD